MIYMGSKARIAKDILKVMQSDINKADCFVDMFCGGGNLLQYVNAKYIIANDISPYVIAFLKRIQREGCDWLPKNNKEFTKEDYKYVKNNKEMYDKSMLGHIGHNLSFGGKWFGGWCSNSEGKDYVWGGYKNAIKQYNNLKDKNILFYSLNYDEVPLLNNCVIYCDIPYKNTTRYKTDFNYDKFYEWCRKLKKENNNITIYVSEYDMPDDFECVWQKEIKMTMDKKDNSRTAVEKLFKLK